MTPLAIAHLVVVLHFTFLIFAIFGGVLVWWRAGWAWLHLPALVWGVWIELSHGICPLTVLENRLLDQAGVPGYGGGFIAHYLVPVLYPPGLQPWHQVALAVALVTFNAYCYYRAWRHHSLARD